MHWLSPVGSYSFRLVLLANSIVTKVGVGYDATSSSKAVNM